MKKFLALLISLTLAMTLLGGCGNSGNDTKQDANLNADDESQAEGDLVERPTFTKDDKLIALSFDDGPSSGSTTALLDYFEEMNIVGTFFVIGDNVNDDTAEIINRALSLGCEIGNHTKSHISLADLSADDIKSEISYVQDIVTEYTGTTPTLFRPPYLSTSQTMFDNIDLTFIFGKDSLDWTGISAEERAENILNLADDGVIILMHDGWENFNTVEAVKTVVPILIEQGYQFCTISELFEAKGVTPEANSGVIYSQVG